MGVWGGCAHIGSALCKQRPSRNLWQIAVPSVLKTCLTSPCLTMPQTMTTDVTFLFTSGEFHRNKKILPGVAAGGWPREPAIVARQLPIAVKNMGSGVLGLWSPHRWAPALAASLFFDHWMLLPPLPLPHFSAPP